MFVVLSNISGVFEHQETKSLSRRAGGDIEKRAPGGGRQQVLLVLEAPRGVRDTGTRASAKRTLSRGVEAVREGTPQNVSFGTPF